MKEIMIIEPEFFKKFHCVGSACPDHCCKGWEIELDKPTVNRYIQSDKIEIRNIAMENIIATKESHGSWGKIKLNSNENCAFLDEDHLCKVHKSLGEKALSTTCAIYPRLYASYKYEIRSNLTLSCPEATKLLLTIPGAMLYSEKTKLSPEALNTTEISQEDRLLNLMCTNIMLSCGMDIEGGLYGIINLFIYLDKLAENEELNENILIYFDNIHTTIQNGQIRKSVNELTSNYQLQSMLLLQLQEYLSKKYDGRGLNKLRHYYQKLNCFITKDMEKDGILKQMRRLNKIWEEKAMKWLQERPHLLSNYFQYRMYEDFFPLKNERKYFTNLYLLMSEWLLLKWLIAASIELSIDFTEEDVINIIYSYHSITRHDKYAEDAFLAEIEKINIKDNIFLLYLLK